jgi:RNA helicase armi
MIIIVSTVRTNQTHLSADKKFGLGFIQCSKRMNVAVSRARALLVVFGKEKLLEIDQGWKQLIDYTRSNNTYVVE